MDRTPRHDAGGAGPASYNDLFTDATIRDHVGWVWYQRQVRIPRGWAGERVFVRVDAATHEGRVYVNDELVAEHVGGYTPFEADITEIVRAGDEIRRTIGVSNELTNETIPPGSIKVDAHGRKKLSYLHDFYNYAGLARSVWAAAPPPPAWRTSPWCLTSTARTVSCATTRRGGRLARTSECGSSTPVGPRSQPPKARPARCASRMCGCGNPRGYLYELWSSS